MATYFSCKIDDAYESHYTSAPALATHFVGDVVVHKDPYEYNSFTYVAPRARCYGEGYAVDANEPGLSKLDEYFNFKRSVPTFENLKRSIPPYDSSLLIEAKDPDKYMVLLDFNTFHDGVYVGVVQKPR